MHTWKTHLVATLYRLHDQCASASLDEVQRWLGGILEAQSVTFLGPDHTPLPRDTPLAELLAQPFLVDLRVDCATTRSENSGYPSPTAEGDDAGESRFHVGAAPEAADEDSAASRFAHFVRDFDRLERKRGFMWAGYIVRELLPRLGYPLAEAKVVLDRLRADGILTVAKVENPRNPEFPATAVHLNREHPQVLEALESTVLRLPATRATLAPTHIPGPDSAS